MDHFPPRESEHRLFLEANMACKGNDYIQNCIQKTEIIISLYYKTYIEHPRQTLRVLYYGFY